MPGFVAGCLGHFFMAVDTRSCRTAGSPRPPLRTTFDLSARVADRVMRGVPSVRRCKYSTCSRPRRGRSPCHCNPSCPRRIARRDPGSCAPCAPGNRSIGQTAPTATPPVGAGVGPGGAPRAARAAAAGGAPQPAERLERSPCSAVAAARNAGQVAASSAPRASWPCRQALPTAVASPGSSGRNTSTRLLPHPQRAAGSRAS